MFPVTLTAYGQSLISNVVNIDKIVLVYETVNIESVSSLAPYLPALFEEDACGNLKNNIGNVYIRDLRDDSTSYQANTILFCKYDGSELKPVAGYSQDTPIVKKSDNQILSVYLSFDFSVFTNGFLFASIQAGYSTAAHNTDGLLHLEDPNIESDDTYSVYSKPQADALLQAKQPLLTAGDGISLAGNVARTTGIPFGICDDTSTATKFTVTVPGIYKLEDGVCCLVKNGVITSASGFTLNVNGLGAKPVYSNMAAATRETTLFNVAYTMLFVYDSTRVDGGCWVCYRGYYTSTNSIGYQLRTSTSTLPVKFTTYRYRLYFLSPDHTHFIGANESTSTNATAARVPTSEKIDPFGRIVYYSTNGTTNAGSNLTASAIWDQYAITLGYSFGPFTLTANRPVYLKCTPQSDGSAIIDESNTIMQTLPESADGKIYIFLGLAYSTTQIELYINHPVYYHDGTGIRIWPGKTIPSKTSDLTNDSGFITSADIPSDISAFNNDVGYITTETDPTVPSWAKQTNKPSYNLDEISDGSTRKLSNYVPTSRKVNGNALTSDVVLDLDDISDGANRKLPTKVSDLTNDSGFISTETDPTVPSWAKQPTKPTYTAAEVGALPDTTVIPTVYNATLTIKKNNSDTGDTFTANASQNKTINLGLANVATTGSYNDLTNKPSIPTDTSDLTNGAGFITSADVPTKVSDLTNDAGYITTETDPTVPNWAKQQNKPSYTLDEVSDGSTRKLSNYVPTSRKINNKALTADITLTLDDVANGTNRKIPTKVSELTNDSGYLTSYTETDPTVPAWAKQQNKPSYTASEVGALPDTTVIPSNTSDLTNDSGFITSADIPSDVSAFNNDAGYLTSYTETDPTVPSWAKQQNKPSYNLDEVPDGATRKLSNYVPTSRKINDKALTGDITLNLDNIADGSSRKLSNYVINGEIFSTINPFDNRRQWLYAVHNTLWSAHLRYDVTLEGFTNNNAQASIFDGSFDSNITISAGGTGIITISGKNNTKMFGGGYPYGYLEVAFYYTSVPESVTCRVYSDWAQNPGWHNVTLTNVCKNTNNALYRGLNSGFYGVTTIEITVNAKSDKAASVTEVAFYQTRGTLQQMAVFNKGIAQTLYHELTGPKFKTTGGTSSQFVKGDGTLDSNTYITSASLPTKVSDLTNDAGYITSASLPTKVSDLTNDAGYITSSALSPYELKNNLKEGAYVDVDETTMTSASTNLPTSKAVASYISGQGFATTSQIPTKTSDLTNDSGFLTQHQSLAGVVASAQYNATDKTIEFYNSAGTKLNTDIDASAFIKDGMVDTVSVTNGKLVITFNTDSGKSDIEIPISDIFDASNYYTKTEIDNAGYLTSSDLSGYVQKVSSTDNAITRFDGTSGAVQNSGVLIDDSNNLLIPLGSSGTFSQNSKLVIGNAWFGSNTTGGLAYGVKSGSTYTSYYTFESTTFRPVSSSDNSIDIGTSSYRWKDLYIAGKICKNGTYKITIPSATGTMALTSDIPTKTSDLTNDSGYITISSVPTKTSDLTNDSGYITIASVPTDTSDLTNGAGFITSASVPTKTSDLTNDSGYITSAAIPTGVAYFNNDAGYLTSSDLSGYALTANLKEGAYVNVDETTTTASSTNLTTGKSMAAYVSSVLPTVNNATLTIQKNGTTVNTFTANASSNVTANITVPTTVAELTDAGDYVTNDDLDEAVQDALEEHQNKLVAGDNITITQNSSILPSEYAQVEYIQSNGSSYLDTGIVPTDETKIVLDIFNNSNGSFYAIGARASSSSTILLAQSGSSTGATVFGSFNGTTIVAKTNGTNWTRTQTGQRYLLSLETSGGTGTYSVYDYTNDREFSSQTSYTALGTVTAHICVLGFNSSNVLGGTSRVYKCEIYQNDTLAFKGIPCYRLSDGRYGLYDVVSNSFKTSVTSTQLTGSTEIHDTLTISAKDEKAQWGKITGTLSNQTDLKNALDLKANSADLADVATSGSYNDLTNKPTIPTVPTNVSAFTNDAGYLTSYTETDPTVPGWAKQSSKPSYTLDEVSDGSTRKLSNYVPTSRKVNNQALTSDITLTLDNISDGSTRKLSNYVPTSRKINNKALTSDITLTLDNISDGTNRKIPTDTADLTNGAGFITSFTETDPTVPSWAKQSSKPSYNLDEVTDGTNRKLPAKVSDLNNDAGYITSYTETDPTVPAWAKASTKPSYTASEVGALPDTTVIPSKTSDLTNDSGFITSADVPAKTTARSDGGYLYNGQSVDIVADNIGLSSTNNLINTSGVTAYVAIRANSGNPFLGLKEGSNLWYAQAASNYFYFGPTSTKALRLDQSGNGVFQTGSCTAKGFVYKNGSTSGTSSQVLVANGTVNTLKTVNNESLLGTGNITVAGDTNVIESISVNDVAQTITNKNVNITVPTKTSDLTNDSGFLTSYTETDPTVPSWAKQSSKPSYTLDEVTDGTTRKLSNYELKSNLKEGAYVNVDETTMTSTSTNLPTGKAVATYISNQGFATTSQLPTVNNSTITIKKNTNDTGDSFTLNQSTGKTINLGLSAVATSGSYNDLTDTPSIQDSLTPGDGIAIDSNDVIRTTGIPFGIVDSTSTNTAFTVTVPGIYKLEDGVTCMVKNGVVTSASGFTINVNGLGAKPVYSSLAAASRETTIFNKAYTLILVYDSTRVEDGAWLCYRATDTNAAYVRFNEISRKPTQTARYYKLYFTSADGTKWVPASKNSTNNATGARPVCQDPIDPFGTIAYSSSSTNYTTSTNVAPSSLWTHYSFTLGYSFNVNGGTWALTVGSPVYIKCAPQANSSAIMDAETPIVQTLPNTADGKIYIFLGVASAATKVEMTTNHPIYYHDGTGIKIWTGGASSAGGGTADKLSNARNLEGVLFDGSEDATHYAYCETAASTQIKDVVIPNFNLTAGARVIVKFKYGNTINDPKLRVNTSSSTTDGTAKDICNAENIPVAPQTNNYTSWEPGYVLEFVYDGTKYIRIGYDEHVVYSSYTSRVDNGQGEGIYGTGTTGDVDYNYVLASDSDILPATTDDFDLGKSDRAWANVYSTKFIKPNGTSSQFLKADGSVDSNTYLTSANLSSYVTTNTTQSITGIKSFYGVKFNYTNTSLTGFGYASDTGIYSTGNGTSSCFMNYAAATTSGEHRFKIANVDKFKINSDGATIYNGGTLSFLNANNTSNYTLSSATSTVTVGEGTNATTVTKKHAVCSADIIRSDTDNKTDLGSPSYKFENIYVNNVRTSGNVIPFAKCTTAATTSQKVATLESGDNFTYIDNSLVLVHFSETNLRNNPTLYITGDQSTSNNTVVNNYRKIYFGAYEAASGLDPNDPNYEDTLRTPGHTVWDSWMGGETVLMLCRYGRYYIIGKMYGGMSVGTDTAGANIATSYPRYISAIDARRFASGGDASLQANTSPIGIGLWNHFYNASMDGSGGTQWNKVTQGFIAGWGLGGIIGSAIRGYGSNMQINRGSESDTTLYTSSSHEGVGSVRMFLLKREVVSYDSTAGTSRCTGYVTGDLVNSDAHYGSGGNDLLEYVECKPVTTVTSSEVTASTTYERKSVFATGTWAMITPTTDIYATSGIYYYLVFAVRVL